MRVMSEATPPSSKSAPLAFTEPQLISPNITLQAPLSRRGKGPGLILVLNHYALVEQSEKHLDPPPLQKWAEEGFAVVQLLIPGKPEDGGEFPLQKVLEVLKGCDGCEYAKGVGLICKCYLTHAPRRTATSFGNIKLQNLRTINAAAPRENRRLLNMARADNSQLSCRVYHSTSSK